MREIWFARLGVNVGSEQDGVGADFLRPVLVYLKFNTSMCFVFPLSTIIKTNRYSYCFAFRDIPNDVLLSQLRLLDVKRLSHKIGVISKEDFQELNKKTRHCCLDFFVTFVLRQSRAEAVVSYLQIIAKIDDLSTIIFEIFF